MKIKNPKLLNKMQELQKSIKYKKKLFFAYIYRERYIERNVYIYINIHI